MPIDVRPGITIPDAALRWRFSRSSGPGGQGVNTTDSRVELSVDLTTAPGFSATMRERALERLRSRLTDGVLTVTAQENRSQLQNREAAAARLAEVLREATAAPPKKRRATRPSKSAVESRISEKKNRAQIKEGRRRPTSD